MIKQNTSNYILLFLLAVFSSIFMHLRLPHQLGVNPDSIVYISGASNLLKGMGYSHAESAITHYPPLYSITLAFFSLFIPNVMDAARILNIFLFGAYIILIGIIIYQTAGRRRFIVILGVAFFSTLAPVLFFYSWVWSEPLFIAILLANIIFLVRFSQSGTNKALLLSAIFSGLLVVTRYIGIAFIPITTILVFFFSKPNIFRKKIFITVIWLIIAITPVTLVVIRNYLVAGSATNRLFAMHPFSFQLFIFNIIKSFYLFISPSIMSFYRPVWIGLFCGVVITPYILYSLTKNKKVASIRFLPMCS